MRLARVISFPIFIMAANVSANEYPTIESVRQVVVCMAENGGQTEETLYACSCRLDSFKAAFTFEEFENVSVYVRNRAMPGEKGAVFRDLGKSTKELRSRYKQVEEQAQKNCPVAKRVVRKNK